VSVFMNIAIVIGISKYNAYQEIIASKEDAIRVKQLLDATGKYKEILFINENTESETVKDKIRSFIDFQKNDNEQNIEEVFYYFSGHGKFEDQEFYMLCSDYEEQKLNMTSLPNSEIDDFLRIVSPKLTVKVIDACYSGYRYLKENNFINSNNNFYKNNFDHLIFMASSHDDQQSQMMMGQSYFTEKFVEGALSAKIDGKVLYRDIQAFIADEFRKMKTQNPLFTGQNTGTEIFASYTEDMKHLKEEWYSRVEESSNQMQDNIESDISASDENDLVDKIENILEEKDSMFIEEDLIEETLNNMKDLILRYEINDHVVSRFYKIDSNWDKQLRHLDESDSLLKTADRETWSQQYLIEIETKTIQEPSTINLLGFPSYRTVEKPASLNTLHSLPYEVIWIEFHPIDKLSIEPFVGIIALIHSETHIMTLFHKGKMVKNGWRSFAVDWDSIKWSRQVFSWKDFIDSKTDFWNELLEEIIQAIKSYLVSILSKNS